MVKIKSFAKVNLCLYVLGKREDGYHEIFSVMQAVDLWDELTLSKIPRGIRVECDDPKVPLDNSNLSYRAAELLLDRVDIDSGVKIKIKKKIPQAAGLGGGSSNAAFTLIGLNKLFDLGLAREDLHPIAEQVGSDVPFFLYSGQAVARGRGERIKEVELPKDYWIVLVKPNFKMSTYEVYKNFKIDLTKKTKKIKIRFEKKEFHKLLRNWKNDLEGEVEKNFPQIKEIKNRLRKAKAIKSQMSGSGPTVFGIFKEKPEEKEVRKLFREDYQVFLTKPILLGTEIFQG
ncbi:MAG: hypothetical protein AMJ90_04870 [candidate division Zixibacteria bacterium SM23_73_2]|nr:MAG: hypothetical protein AMJ90_04870 [candidate division Zixibacteria bacterium SM23_73_2]